jgi:hypothetical protein
MAGTFEILAIYISSINYSAMRQITLSKVLTLRNITLGYLLSMCVTYSFLSIGGLSIMAFIAMCLSPFFLILKAPYISKAVLWGGGYALLTFLVSLLHGNMRFSTIGFLLMYIITYIVFYYFIYSGAFTLKFFHKVVRGLIIAFVIVLILQQLCLLIGIINFPLLNLSNQSYLSIDKLPSLTLEPSHTARLLTIFALCHLRCLEKENQNKKVDVKYLFTEKERGVTLLFLWAMLTMGSGTAFVGLGILSLYFIQWSTAIYIVPLLGLMFYIAQSMEVKQFNRAYNLAIATSTGSVKRMDSADQSGAQRIIPILNTLRMDLSKKETWIGKGTMTREYASRSWLRKTDCISCVEQYGLITFAFSLILLFSCMIHRVLSLETLIFILLFGLSLTNIAYIWGSMMMFTTMKYFLERGDDGYEDTEEDES